MRWKHAVAAAVVAGVGVFPAGSGSETDLLSAVQAREEERRRAMVAVDVASLDDLFAADATYVHSNGLSQSKADVISMLARGEIRYVSFDVKEASYRAYGATVVATGVQEIRLTSSGKPFTSNSRYTVVYATIDGEPKMVAYQSTSLPEIVKQEKPKGE
jgi:hypothetical protein